MAATTEKRTVQKAILCANGAVHFGNEYLEHDDPARVLHVADLQAESGAHYRGNYGESLDPGAREGAQR